jgi:predicted nucleotidyltransferase component of viral defense system
MAEPGLAPLQLEVLRAFFARERGFFLTGGGALVGFHLHHRTTDDLDLFTIDEQAFERSRHVLGDVASALGARLEVKQDAPSFRRYALSRGDDVVITDTVLERTVQLVKDKPELDGILVDPPNEILANKLTALVGRTEERDLVDVRALEAAGIRVEDALAAALAKDGGATPATLAWVLSQISIPPSAKLPGGVDATTLNAYVRDLVTRLRKLARP